VGAGSIDPVNNSATISIPVLRNTGIQASFNSLPSKLRSNEKYAWANTGATSAITSSYAGTSTTIDSYRPSYFAGPPPSQTSARQEPKIDTYRPEPISTPTLTHNHSSSPSKASTYSGTARPTTTIRNPYEDANPARTIEFEMVKRRSEQFKKPGILKRSPIVRNPGGIPRDRTPGALTPGYMVNPARKALFAELDVEVVEVVESSDGRPVGRGANRENLPFNRWEQRHQDGEDTYARTKILNHDP
jgi:hypothetical protein